jgi:lipopolysaccharide export system permease protein
VVKKKSCFIRLFLVFPIRTGSALILERYIIREILSPLAAIGLVLIAIFSGYSATRFLNDAVNGLLSGQTVAVLVLLKVLIALEVLLPVTLCLAVVLALSRLYADGEIPAMEAGGIAPGRITKAVFFLAFALALLVGGLSYYARPWAYEKIYTLEAGAGKDFDFAKVEAGRFYELGNDLIFFAEQLDSDAKQARNVYVWELTPDGRKVTFAEMARQEDATAGRPKSIVFRNGHHYILTTTANRDRFIDFEKSVLPLTPVVKPLEYRRKAAPSVRLASAAEPKEVAEYQWRLSTGPATILLALLAIPFSRTAPRRSRYGKATAILVLFFLYYNFSLITKTWVEKQVIPPFPGIWSVVLVLGLLVLLLVFIPGLKSRRAIRRAASSRRVGT